MRWARHSAAQLPEKLCSDLRYAKEANGDASDKVAYREMRDNRSAFGPQQEERSHIGPPLTQKANTATLEAKRNEGYNSDIFIRTRVPHD